MNDRIEETVTCLTLCEEGFDSDEIRQMECLNRVTSASRVLYVSTGRDPDLSGNHTNIQAVRLSDCQTECFQFCTNSELHDR